MKTIHIYYLNQYGGEGGTGFAAYADADGGGNSKLTFTSVPADPNALKAGTHIMLAKIGEYYYIVNNSTGKYISHGDGNQNNNTSRGVPLVEKNQSNDESCKFRLDLNETKGEGFYNIKVKGSPLQALGLAFSEVHKNFTIIVSTPH